MAAVRLGPRQRPPGHPDVLSPVFWLHDRVVLLDQRRLPHEEVWTGYDDGDDIVRAIREMEVRGAPAIGCAGAFAVALMAGLGLQSVELRRRMRAIVEARPTAVNLAVAVHRMANALTMGRDPVVEAQLIWNEDLAACRAIGNRGAALLPAEGTILTHCNAGGLATAGYGTALGIVRAAVAAGKRISVLCDETRPWLQGARLTTWELAQDGIPVEVIEVATSRTRSAPWGWRPRPPPSGFPSTLPRHGRPLTTRQRTERRFPSRSGTSRRSRAWRDVACCPTVWAHETQCSM